jgi:hypothetical protein
MMRLALGVLFVASIGCHAPAAEALPSQAEWLAARSTLESLRAGEPTTPFGAMVHVVLHDARSGRAFAARGAVVVDPHRALRMVLIGPAGATALDVWATADRWRFEVPAAHVLRRGGREDDPTVPVGFFRWWFLGAVDGRLLTSVTQSEGTRLVLRSEQSTIDLTARRSRTGLTLAATRRAAGAVDHIELRGLALAPSAGDRVTYDREESGVHVEVSVESRLEAPDPAAFLDPDGPLGERVSG